MMTRLVMLAVAGAAGTVSRYLLGGWMHQWLGWQFPYGTFFVNVMGCVGIGFLGTLFDERMMLSSPARQALFIGFLGAFTTFSSFAYESWTLFKDSQWMLAGVNVVGSVITCFVGLLLGVLLARAL